MAAPESVVESIERSLQRRLSHGRETGRDFERVVHPADQLHAEGKPLFAGDDPDPVEQRLVITLGLGPHHPATQRGDALGKVECRAIDQRIEQGRT